MATNFKNIMETNRYRKSLSIYSTRGNKYNIIGMNIANPTGSMVTADIEIGDEGSSIAHMIKGMPILQYPQ